MFHDETSSGELYWVDKRWSTPYIIGVTGGIRNPTTPYTVRRNTAKPTVAWAIQVEETDHADFLAIYPLRGAFSGIIAIALQLFLDRLEAEPQLQVWAHEDIGRHLHLEERPERKQLIEINIPTALYERFNRILPEYGATSWFVRRLIEALIQLGYTPLGRQVTAAVEVLILPGDKRYAVATKD